jgi:hypothetical protein
LAASIFGQSSMLWINALEIFGAGELIFLFTLYRKFNFGIIVLSAIFMVAAVIILLSGIGQGIQYTAAQIVSAGLIGFIAWMLGKIFKRI